MNDIIVNIDNNNNINNNKSNKNSLCESSRFNV